jgi:hypothetical protein
VNQSLLKERMELLAIGEAMDWPRLGYGRTPEGGKLAIKPGKAGWEKFVKKPMRAGVPGVLTALRIARTLHNYGIKPYDPRPKVENVSPPSHVIKLDDPVPEVIHVDTVIAARDEMVKPKRSSAAMRQARWRQRQKEAHATA